MMMMMDDDDDDDDDDVAVQNPDLIILERQHHSSQEAFIGKNFSLPRDATPGTWFITAYFEGSKVTGKLSQTSGTGTVCCVNGEVAVLGLGRP